MIDYKNKEINLSISDAREIAFIVYCTIKKVELKDQILS